MINKRKILAILEKEKNEVSRCELCWEEAQKEERDRILKIINNTWHKTEFGDKEFRSAFYNLAKQIFKDE